MSKIEYCTNKTALYVDYRKILEKKITMVCNEIGFNDSNVTWFIFDPDELKNNNKSIFGQRIRYSGRDYGFCDIKKRKIWISTAAIMKDNSLSLFNKTYNQFKLSRSKERDFLAEVIIDEITHIQTGCDHGNHKYDMQLRENARRYYVPLIERILVKR